MTDLHAIIGAALPSQRQLDTARESGISAEAMIRAGGFGIADVAFLDSTFELDGQGFSFALYCLEVMAYTPESVEAFMSRHLRRGHRTPTELADREGLENEPERWRKYLAKHEGKSLADIGALQSQSEGLLEEILGRGN